jgi:hypothetical protein
MESLVCIPLHSLRTLFVPGSDKSELLPQSSNLLDCFADIRRQAGSNSPSNNVCHSRTVSTGADHDLQRTISVLTSKVKVALWRDIGNVCNNPLLFTQLPDGSRGFWVVDSGHDHSDFGVVEVGGFEGAIVVFDEALFNTIGDFIVETVTGTDETDFGVRVEEVQDATSGYLCF